MIVSNEPGYYEDGKFGIRIENLAMIHEAGTEFRCATVLSSSVYIGCNSNGAHGCRRCILPALPAKDVLRGHRHICALCVTCSAAAAHLCLSLQKHMGKVAAWCRFAGKAYMTMTPLTYVPIETKLMNVAELSPEERNWVNAYHAQVRSRFAPSVPEHSCQATHCERSCTLC